MKALAENIYYEDSYSGVVLGAILFPGGTLLIDTPLRADDARTWKAALLTQSRGAHRMIVILDIHADRTLGNRAIEYPIIAHADTAKAFGQRTTIFKGQNIKTGAEWEHHPEVSGTRWERPNITFSTALSLHWGGPEIHIESHPGPTSGASWVHIPEHKIVFIGDAVCNDQPPFIANANLDAWHETLNLLASRTFADYTIISGRSGFVSVEDVREQRKFLKSISGRLDTANKRKYPAEEIEKMVPALLEKINYPAQLDEFYSQRLLHGLQEYFARNYLHDSTLFEAED